MSSDRNDGTPRALTLCSFCFQMAAAPQPHFLTTPIQGEDTDSPTRTPSFLCIFCLQTNGMDGAILSFAQANPGSRLSVDEASSVLAGVFSMRLRAWRRCSSFGSYVSLVLLEDQCFIALRKRSLRGKPLQHIRQAILRLVERGDLVFGVHGLAATAGLQSHHISVRTPDRGVKRPRTAEAFRAPQPAVQAAHTAAKPPAAAAGAIQPQAVLPHKPPYPSGQSACRAPASAVAAAGAGASASSGSFLVHAEQATQRMEDSPASSNGQAGLNAEQADVLKAILAGKSVFFTGSAGSGKSFLLRKCIDALLDSGRAKKDQIFITAATGIAAVNIGGSTFHSFSGLGLGKGPLSALLHKVTSSTAASERWRKAKVLIIDEVSMLDGQLLDKAEQVARSVRGSSAPFGGLQLVLCGDFFQLPPVGVTKRRQKQQNQSCKDEDVLFAFQAACWPRIVQHSVLLSRVYRQRDNKLLDVLQRIRLGQCTPTDCEFLAACGTQSATDSAGVQPTVLCALNKHVQQRNASSLHKLSGERHEYTAHFNGIEHFRKQLASSCTADEVLTLCAGAQVVLLTNLDAETGLVNGARGKVHDFVRNTESAWPTLLPRVIFCPPGRPPTKPLEVPAHSWTVEVGAETKASMTQVPLKLAYALSIHKSQGMTIDSLLVDLRGVFEYGQAYVALSRGVSLERMQVLNMSPNCVRAHPDVVQFYKTLSQESVPPNVLQGGSNSVAQRPALQHSDAAHAAVEDIAADALQGLDASDIFGDLG